MSGNIEFYLPIHDPHNYNNNDDFLNFYLAPSSCRIFTFSSTLVYVQIPKKNNSNTFVLISSLCLVLFSKSYHANTQNSDGSEYGKHCRLKFTCQSCPFQQCEYASMLKLAFNW